VHRAPGIPHALCFQGEDLLQTSGASRRENAKLRRATAVIASEAKQSMEQQKERMDCFAPLAMTRGMDHSSPNCHRPRRRVIQYSETPVIESINRGALDTPQGPVIGLAEGETR
jgi:hypothetical protein